jgi:hypothetical protein
VGCGVLYHPKEARRSNKYCSRPCAIIHRKIHPKGFTNSGSFKPGVPSWNNGVDGYLAGHEVSEETKEKGDTCPKILFFRRWDHKFSFEKEEYRSG